MSAQHAYVAPKAGQEGCQCSICVCRRLSDTKPELVKNAPLLLETLSLVYKATCRDPKLDPWLKAHMEYTLAKAAL